MNESPIHYFLQKKIGLNLQSIGPATLARAIKSRMQATGIQDEKTYFGSLQVSPVEVEELIEQVVIPETWFFRHRESFALLSRLASASRGPLRILSIPCSSGEEPYSIAMTLVDAGVPARNFQIDAIDISGSAVQKAKEGLYKSNSFREEDLQFRQSHFQKVDQGWQLSNEIRKAVHFFQHNFLEAHPFLSRYNYDVIFCRNFLIYLNSDARRRVLQTLHGMLTQEGTLFVGHSEAGLPLIPFFHIIRPLAAFAHQKNPIGTS